MQIQAVEKALDYKVKDIALAEMGRKQMELVRERDAGPDGHSRKVRALAALRRTQDHRLSAHDHRDRHADRDPQSLGGRHPLGVLQYLLHPRLRCRRDCPGRLGSRLCLERRNTRGILVVHRAGLDLARRVSPDLIVDDGGDATLFVLHGVRAEKNPAILDKPADCKDMEILINRLRDSLDRDPTHWTRGRRQPTRRLRGNHHRRPSALSNEGRRRIALPRRQCQRLRHQVQV